MRLPTLFTPLYKQLIKKGSFRTVFKLWIEDYQYSRERCSYCGWFLHPGLLFKNNKRPSTLTYWKETDGLFICSHCHYIKETATKSK